MPVTLLGIEVVIDAARFQAGITMAQLLSSRRHPDYVLAREIASVLLRDVRPGVIVGTQPTYVEISRYLDRANHSTVVAACQRARTNHHTRMHARQVCERLAIPRSHWPAWMVGSTQEVSNAGS